MPAIHQFLAGFSKGDAISNEARVMQNIFRRWGYTSDIFCEPAAILNELRSTALDVHMAKDNIHQDDTVLLHLSIGSFVNDLFRELSCRKVILYHNITPAHFFDRVNRQTAFRLEQGQRQMQDLAGAAEINLADSAYNAAELRQAGFEQVDVLPLVLELSSLEETCDRAMLRRLQDGKRNLLFVGRVAPNKRIEDLIELFYVYHRTVDPDSRFLHAGSCNGTEIYHNLLQASCRKMGLKSQEYLFLGSIIQPQLNACYRAADAFICMSEHEGFCIPVIEAMAMNCPVLAYKAAAVPETMDGAGILFTEKNFEEIAELTGRVIHDAPLRETVLNGQQQRMSRFRQRDLEQELRTLLQPVLSL